jgi:hypothetical protein
MISYRFIKMNQIKGYFSPANSELNPFSRHSIYQIKIIFQNIDGRIIPLKQIQNKGHFTLDHSFTLLTLSYMRSIQQSLMQIDRN